MLLLVALWGLWEVGGNLEWGLRTSISPGAGYEPSGELLPGTEMQELAIEPFVKLARGFLTAAECDHLRALVEDRLPARGLVLPREAEERNSSNALNFGMEGETMGVNTGRGHQVPRRYDRTVAVVEARAARLAGALESHGEPLKVWRYDEGTEWTAHGDCKKRPSSKDMAKWAEEGQQRTVTVLLYIGEPDEGGETVFPERQDWAPGVEPWGGGDYSACARAGVATKPRKGDALAFLNILGEGSGAVATMQDSLAVHAACPVLRGTMWVAAKWYREAPHLPECWEAGARGSGNGGDPREVKLKPEARRKGVSPLIKQVCHESEVGMAASPPPDLAVPEGFVINFEDILFKKRIGGGQLGSIMLGSWNGTDVAVKLLKNDVAMDSLTSADAFAEFAREVRFMSQLRHPSVVKFLGAAAAPPDFGMVMELAEHGNLLSVLTKARKGGEGAPRVDDAMRLLWAQDLASGLDYLHTRSPPVVYRDLKAAQVLVDAQWGLKMADFGLAATTEELDVEAKRILVGTPAYMAPEVLRGGRFSEKSDMYQYAFTLFHILSGEPPWADLDPKNVREVVLGQGRRPEGMLQGPPALEQLMRDCWAADPAERPTAAQALERLKGLSAPPPEMK